MVLRTAYRPSPGGDPASAAEGRRRVGGRVPEPGLRHLDVVAAIRFVVFWVSRVVALRGCSNRGILSFVWTASLSVLSCASCAAHSGSDLQGAHPAVLLACHRQDPAGPQLGFTRRIAIRAKHYTPEVTKVTLQWKMSLNIHWNSQRKSTGKGTIRRKLPLTSETPLEHATEIHWNMPLTIHGDF